MYTCIIMKYTNMASAFYSKIPATLLHSSAGGSLTIISSSVYFINIFLETLFHHRLTLPALTLANLLF